MTSNENDSRTVLSPTTGSKICLLIAVVFLVGAAYFLWVPIAVPGSNGRFGCQSAFNPPTDQFPKNVCGTINQLYQIRAAAFLAAGILTGSLGIAFFGVNRRTELRKSVEAAGRETESVARKD